MAEPEAGSGKRNMREGRRLDGSHASTFLFDLDLGFDKTISAIQRGSIG